MYLVLSTYCRTPLWLLSCHKNRYWAAHEWEPKRERDVDSNIEIDERSL